MRALGRPLAMLLNGRRRLCCLTATGIHGGAHHSSPASDRNEQKALLGRQLQYVRPAVNNPVNKLWKSWANEGNWGGGGSGKREGSFGKVPPKASRLAVGEGPPVLSGVTRSELARLGRIGSSRKKKRRTWGSWISRSGEGSMIPCDLDTSGRKNNKASPGKEGEKKDSGQSIHDLDPISSTPSYKEERNRTKELRTKTCAQSSVTTEARGHYSPISTAAGSRFPRTKLCVQYDSGVRTYCHGRREARRS